MRIRKKTARPSAKRPPLYFIGYRGTAPNKDEISMLYDRDFGGPLIIRYETGSQDSWQAIHGPWSVHVVMPMPMSHAAELMKELAWEHESMGAIAPSIASPRDMPDTILLGARLARCLTLLTQGTAYDVATQAYINPADWQTRPLTSFLMDDHLSIAQDEASRPDQVWFYSLGLAKFGLDEVELFQERGLPEKPAQELLTEAAQELLRLGQSPKVGTSIHLSLLGREAQIVNYRTAAPVGRMLGFRELRI